MIVTSNTLVLNIHFLLLQNVFAPDQDPEMITEHYERTFEQNELLGLNDLNTDATWNHEYNDYDYMVSVFKALLELAKF